MFQICAEQRVDNRDVCVIAEQGFHRGKGRRRDVWSAGVLYSQVTVALLICVPLVFPIKIVLVSSYKFSGFYSSDFLPDATGEGMSERDLDPGWG